MRPLCFGGARILTAGVPAPRALQGIGALRDDVSIEWTPDTRAATESGSPRRDDEDAMDAKTLGQLKQSLLLQRDQLSADLADLEKAGHEALSDMSGENNYRDHMGDQGSATFTKELDMSLEENVRELLGQVDIALARIDAGEYGLCRRCGETIGADRLDAVPSAELCIKCKQIEERL